MSLAARLLNVFAIPGDVFAEVKATVPSVGNWLAPALLLLLASWTAAWLIYSQPSIQQQVNELTDRAIQKQIEKGKVTEQQAEMSRKLGRVSARVAPFVAPVFVAVITPFAWGLILWLVGTRVFKASFPYMKAVEVAGLANAVLVLAVIVQTLLIVGLGNLFATASPALLVKDFDPQNPSHSLLAVANVMTVWLLAVRSIGLARLSGVPFIRAAAWVFGIWALYTTIILGFGQLARTLVGG
jgi:hypothetical protein